VSVAAVFPRPASFLGGPERERAEDVAGAELLFFVPVERSVVELELSFSARNSATAASRSTGVEVVTHR
jgi:hypothetical protein